jgi:cell division protein ZipA
MYLKGMKAHDEAQEKETEKKINPALIDESSTKNKPKTNTQDKDNYLQNNISAKKTDSIIYKDNDGKNNAVQFSLKKYISKKISKLFNRGKGHMKDKTIISRKNSIAQYDDNLDKFLNGDHQMDKYKDITDIYDKKIQKIQNTDSELINICLKSKKNDCFTEKLKKTININATDKLLAREGNFNIISVNLIMDDNKKISGKQLLPQILAAGLLYGDMSIFHRYYNNDGTGKILFSLANGMEPGYFNLEEFENLQISALTFFMTIPGPDTLMQAFASMINTATIFAEFFNVEMKDKDFCNITNQTIEHYRQCIRDFQRKQLLIKPTL